MSARHNVAIAVVGITLLAGIFLVLRLSDSTNSQSLAVVLEHVTRSCTDRPPPVSAVDGADKCQVAAFAANHVARAYDFLWDCKDKRGRAVES